MRAWVVAGLLGGLLFAAPALADDEEEEEVSEYAVDGVYALFTGNYFVENFDTEIAPDNSFGAGLHLGYRFLPRVAVEAQVDWIKNFDFRTDTAKVARITNGVVTTANAKVFALTDWIQPYGVIGVGFMNATLAATKTDESQTDTGFAFRVGGGVDFYGDETMALNAEVNYVKPTGGTSDYSFLSIQWGILLRF